MNEGPAFIAGLFIGVIAVFLWATCAEKGFCYTINNQEKCIKLN